MRIRHGISALMLTAVLTGATACGSGTEPGSSESVAAPSESAAPETTMTPGTGAAPTGSASAEAAPAEEAMITIKDFEYEMPATIAPGAEVTVVNEDDAPHTVTAKDDGGFDVEVPAGETVTFTAPGEAGDYAVICTYHPQMTSTLVIG